MKGILRRISFAYLYIKVFGKRHANFLLSGFVIGFFTSLFLLKFYPLFKFVVMPNKKIIGIVGDYGINNLPLSIQNLISRGLTSINPDGSPSPSIATSWEATDSGKVYIFRLKPHILWHDGKTLTSADIIYNLKDAQFSPIDDLTLRIDLKEPFSPLPVVLSRPIFRDNLIGIGPYRVSDFKLKGDTVSLLSLSPLRENDPFLEYKFYSTLDEAILAFKMGEINTLWQLTNKDAFLSWKNIKIDEVTLHDRFIGIFFNTQSSLLKDKETRQGLSFAAPVFGDSQHVNTPISPSSWAYYNKVRIYKSDPENAKKILEKTPLGTSSAELTLSTYAPYLPFAQKVADAWNSVGVNTKVRIETGFPDNFQAFLIAQEIPSDPDQYQFWHSKETDTNISHYANLKIDKLLEDGRKELDIDKRKKIYADFQRYLVDEVPVAFLFFPKVYTIERK